ncbi:MAG: hypothetical protein RLN72_11155 [Henriciella sp.]
MMTLRLGAGLGLLALAACSAVPPADLTDETASDSVSAAETYTIMVSGTEIGALDLTRAGPAIAVDYEYRNNGRGPTLTEAIVLGENGLPTAWSVTGNTTFGNAVDESFALEDGTAVWTDSTGTGEAQIDEPSM